MKSDPISLTLLLSTTLIFSAKMDICVWWSISRNLFSVRTLEKLTQLLFCIYKSNLTMDCRINLSKVLERIYIFDFCTESKYYTLCNNYRIGKLLNHLIEDKEYCRS